MGFLSPPFYEGPLVHLPSSLTEGACIGVQTEASREEGLIEGLYVPWWEVGDIPGLVLFSAQYSFQHWLWKKKIPHPEGKPGKIGKWVTRREGLIGAFRQFGTQLSWTIQELLPGPWEGGDHSTPAQRLGEHLLPWLGLEIHEAGPTTFQRNKKTIIFNKWRQ